MFLNKRKVIFLTSIFSLVFLLILTDAKPQELLVVDGDTKKKMKGVLDKIQSGDFTREWIEEYKSGAKNFHAMRAKIDGHQIEEVGKNLRSMMPWIAKNKLVDKEKN